MELFICIKSEKIMNLVESVGMKNFKESMILLEPVYLKTKQGEPLKDTGEYRGNWKTPVPEQNY